MSLDGKILASSRERLAKRRERMAAEYEEKRARVYGKAPQIAQIDEELSGLFSAALRSSLRDGADMGDIMDAAGKNAAMLRSERSAALKAAGFPEDYLDEKPFCEKCGDSGYIGSSPCSCLMEIYRDEQRKSLSSLIKLGSESFDTFDLSYYDDEYDPKLGKTTRAHMESVYESCREYARKFRSVRYNLFMNGGTGLGKTFLSACIAKTVSQDGFSVVYESAPTLFSRFEAEKFGRGDEEADGEVRRYMTCDLLIVDDLGTELTTAFTNSALYSLINTRLITGKKTIITSNYDMSELRARYTPQIMSRLEGEYIVLFFAGDDIRLKRRGR